MFWNVKICILKNFKLFWIFLSKLYVLDRSESIDIQIDKKIIEKKKKKKKREHQKKIFDLKGGGGGVWKGKIGKKEERKKGKTEEINK